MGKLKESLGENYDTKPDACFQWWQAHKEEFPLETCKLRRILESIIANAGIRLNGQEVNTFWGHSGGCVNYEIKSLDFHYDVQTRKMTVTATRQHFLDDPRDIARWERD